MHDPADGDDQVFRPLEPGVRVVENAALLVDRDPVAIAEPFELPSPVDDEHRHPGFAGFSRETC